MKFVNLMAERVDLDAEADVQAVLFAQLDDPVEDRFPVLVAGEIVVGDEEAVDALLIIHAQDLLDAVGRAIARLASLHVDDGAERALKRATAAGVEARHVADGALDEVDRQERRRGNLADVRQMLHVVVERLELAARGIQYDFIEAFLGFARVDRNPEVLRFLDVGRRLFQHGEAARDVEAADHDLHAGSAQRASDVDRAGKFVRLHADNPDQAETAVVGDAPGDVASG